MGAMAASSSIYITTNTHGFDWMRREGGRKGEREGGREGERERETWLRFFFSRRPVVSPALPEDEENQTQLGQEGQHHQPPHGEHCEGEREVGGERERLKILSDYQIHILFIFFPAWLLI